MTADAIHILGVDPGKQGAIAILSNTGNLIAVEDMPDVTGAALGAALRTLLDDFAPLTFAAAWIEQVGPMPKQGVRSVWTFGEGYGAVLGALGALGVPVHHVTPAHWKRTQRVTKDKASSRQRATELWPEHAGLFRRIKDDGRAESALIARHGLYVGEGS